MDTQNSALRAKRVGVFSGTFNPVHGGHVAFALQACEAARLDAVYFLPERQPRGKQQVAPFAHRVTMLQEAVRKFSNLEVLELTDVTFTTESTLPKLQRKFSDTQLVLLLGSDVVSGLANWPKVVQLLHVCELVIGLREHDRHIVEIQLTRLPIQPKLCTIFATHDAIVSSGKIREALRSHCDTPGLLASVLTYNDQHKLYA